MTCLPPLLLTATLAASSGIQTSADDRQLAQYRLTTDVLTKMEPVAKAFDANLAKDPKVKRRIDAQREIALLDEMDRLTNAEQSRLAVLLDIVGDEPADLGITGGSLTEISAQLQKIPAMAAALRTAAMPARDMAKFIVTAMEAAMTAGLGTPAPPGANENVRFLTTNHEAIDRINRLLGTR